MKTQFKKPFKKSEALSSLLNQMLEKDSQYHPNMGGRTQGGMANHFPMAILAMDGLGATDQELQNFAEGWPQYYRRSIIHMDLVDPEEVTQENWTDYLGDEQALLAFKRIFLNALSVSENQENTLADILLAMVKGLPMGLFHPLIRLSFAKMHGDLGLIADALAYMAIRYQDLYKTDFKVFTNKSKSPTPESIWKAIHSSDPSFKTVMYGGSLSISEQLCSEELIHTLALPADFNIDSENLIDSIKRMSLMALRLYHYEPALTTLHGVTAAHALADLSLKNPSHPAFPILWNHYWIWLTGLYLEKGAPLKFQNLSPYLKAEIQDFSWKELSEQARKIPETHLIKMAYTCKWFYKNIEPNPLYKWAVVRMIESKNAHPPKLRD